MDSEGTSTSSDKDRMEATVSAVNIVAQGKRNMLCGEIPTAVNQFQEACKLLSKAYGETAKECADAYFNYGQALLDLARMETGVLGNALQGVPDTDEEAEQSDEQFEKAELEGKEREKLRQEVYDAMGEKESEKAKAVKTDKPGDTMEIAMDTDKKDEEPVEKSKDKDETEKDKADKKEEADEKKEKADEKKEKADEKKERADKEKEKAEEKGEKDQVEAKTDKPKLEKDDTSVDKSKEECSKDKTESKEVKDKSPKSKDKAKSEKEQPEEEQMETEEPSEKPSIDKKIDKDSKDQVENKDKEPAGKEEEKDKLDAGKEAEKSATKEEGSTEDDGEEEEEEGGDEEGEAGEGEEEATEGDTGDEAKSQDGSQDGENPDDVSNLQLAWEMLELAKLIYLKDDSKEAKLRAGEAHLKLGEVSLETEQYESAVGDFNKCLAIQKEILEPENRLLAETYYQLGLAYCFNKQFTESVDSYKSAIKTIEDRIASLNKILEKATDEQKKTSDFDDPVYKANKEVNDLTELLPDIKSKIEDTEDERKNMEELKNMAKEAMGGVADVISSSSTSSSLADKPAPTKSSTSQEEVQTTDISHLIKRKRKPEDEAAEEQGDSTKKTRQEDGTGDATTKVNGVSHSPEKKEAPMEESKPEESKPAEVAAS